MSVSQANQIANKLLPKCEGMLGNPPKGQSFKECYDVGWLRPTQDWLSIYETVKEEVVRAGIPLG